MKVIMSFTPQFKLLQSHTIPHRIYAMTRAVADTVVTSLGDVIDDITFLHLPSLTFWNSAFSITGGRPSNIHPRPRRYECNNNNKFGTKNRL